MRNVMVAIYSVAQLAYPKSFRAQFGSELAAVFRARIDAAFNRGLTRGSGLGIWLSLDAIASGVAERLYQLRRSRPQPTRRRPMFLESIFSDVRLAIRRLRHAPVFAAAAIATLALGIGASTAIFSVANAVLLRPLPYHDPGALVAVWSNNTPQNEPRNPVSPANFEAFRSEARSFEAVEATYGFLVNSQLELPAGVETVSTTAVTPGMFDLLGRPALHGRTLRKGDDQAVVISHALWMRAFNGDPKIVGATIKALGVPAPFEIIGVMPADFVFPYKTMLGPSGFTRALSADAWQLIPMTGGRWVDQAGQPLRTLHYLSVIGRLKPDTSPAAAQAELGAIAARRSSEFKDTNAGWDVTTLPLHDQVVGRVRPAVIMLLAGVGLLLLMTCLNLANVMLARATGRQRDLAVRTALGASASRLTQQALVESLTVAFFGALAGAAVMLAGTRLIVAMAPSDLPRLSETSLSWNVAGFAVVLTVVTGLLVGLLPALTSRRARVAGINESHRTSASATRQRVRSALVVAEIALATVLVVGTGLLVRSFVAVTRVDPGFNATHILTFQQNVPSRVQTPGARIEFLDELSARLAAIPGVTRIGGTTRIPLGSTQVTTQLTVEGRDVPAAHLPEVEMRRAVGDFFAAMSIPVLEGRVFDPTDRTATTGLAVVNAALAKQVFRNEAVVGRRVRIGPPSPNALWLTIVGVVGDIRHTNLEQTPRPEIYLSYLQGPPSSPFMAVRVEGDPEAVVPAIRRVISDLGADPPYNVSTMQGLRSESMAMRTFTVLLAGLFGVLALVLAGVGIYGVMALVVAERNDEIGVRSALGATPGQIVSMIVGQAGRLGSIGIAIGLAAGLGVAQIARSLLFGVSASDIVTFVAVPTLLLVVALMAAYLPARRATKISPIAAMRS